MKNQKHYRRKAARVRASPTRPEFEPTGYNSKLKARRNERDTFECKNCGRQIASGGSGSEHRNHCPHCLCSQHLDIVPGDREADCGGVMDAVAVWVRKNGEWAIVHRCRICGAFSSNRIAADDNEYALLSIAAKAIANPPFPVERLPSH